jgi:hypothetical protein
LEPCKSFAFDCIVSLKVLTKFGSNFGCFASIKVNEMKTRGILCSRTPFSYPPSKIEEILNQNLVELDDANPATRQSGQISEINRIIC